MEYLLTAAIAFALFVMALGMGVFFVLYLIDEIMRHKSR